MDINTLPIEVQPAYLRGCAAKALALVEVALNLQVLQARNSDLPLGKVCNTHIQSVLIAAQQELACTLTNEPANFQITEGTL